MNINTLLCDDHSVDINNKVLCRLRPRKVNGEVATVAPPATNQIGSEKITRPRLRPRKTLKGEAKVLLATTATPASAKRKVAEDHIPQPLRKVPKREAKGLVTATATPTRTKRKVAEDDIPQPRQQAPKAEAKVLVTTASNPAPIKEKGVADN